VTVFKLLISSVHLHPTAENEAGDKRSGRGSGSKE